MKIVSNKAKLKKFIQNLKNLGFVPTMGAFHPGHISLIKKSIKECDKTVVSIFINKPQFNQKNDYLSYPRSLKKDIQKLKQLNVDFLYLPKNKEIYPKGPNKKIKISSFKNKLCGKFRPGHFEAVVDVVYRFIKIIKPKNIYLGLKDFQQLKLIENFIEKKHINTKVIACKTIRQKDGLAYSSRNFILKNSEKILASKISKIIKNNKKKVIKNKIKLKDIKNKIYNMGVKKIDYVEVLDINKIIKPYKSKILNKIFIAYYIKKVRLIDNF